MTTSHLTEDDLVLHYYGEMGPADETAATGHLRACDSCRASYAGLQRVLGAIDESAFDGVEPPPSFERTVWARLEPNLRRERRGWFSWFLTPAPLALGGAIAMLVVAAFFAGRALPPSPPVATPKATPVASEHVRERILLSDLGYHLDRSQMMLVEMVSGDQDTASLSGDRERAEELVADNRIYRLAAEQAGDTAVSELLDEIERVLTEIAASPERALSQDLVDLRQRIESRDLLFKVRVVSSQVRERQKQAVRGRTSPRS